MSRLWEAKDFADDGAMLGQASVLVHPDVVGFLASAEAGVYLTRDDVTRLRDACDQLLAGGAS